MHFSELPHASQVVLLVTNPDQPIFAYHGTSKYIYLNYKSSVKNQHFKGVKISFFKFEGIKGSGSVNGSYTSVNCILRIMFARSRFINLIHFVEPLI